MGRIRHHVPLDASRVDAIAARVGILLTAGRFALAHDAVDEAELLHHATTPRGLDVRLGDTSLSARLLGVLERAGVTTIGDLASRTAEELHAIHGVGGGAIETLREIVLQHLPTEDACTSIAESPK